MSLVADGATVDEIAGVATLAGARGEAIAKGVAARGTEAIGGAQINGESRGCLSCPCDGSGALFGQVTRGATPKATW